MLLDDTFYIGRFERFEGDSALWNRFIDEELNNLDDVIDEFKWLISHEYIEAKLREKGMNFRSLINQSNEFVYDTGAHFLSVKANDITYNMGYSTFERINSTPPLPNQNLTNLDEIVDWFYEFYKLNN